MTVNKFIAIALLWLSAQLICLAFNGQVFGTEEGFRGFFDQFTVYQLFQNADGLLDYVNVPASVVQDLGMLVSFDYPFFTGYLIIVRFILMGVSAGFIWGLITTLRR